MPVTIFAATARSQMEAYRRSVKDSLGDHYESRIAPYVALILKSYWDKKESGLREMDAYEIARELWALLKGNRKRNQKPAPSLWIQAILMSAALEIIERNMYHIRKKPRKSDLPVPSLEEDERNG